MKKNLSHIINIMFIPILFVFAIWFVKGFEYINETDFRQFGIKAWDLNKITGIFTFPFLHADLNHLINNSYPILILGGIISQVYNTISNKVFLYSFLLSGIILFIIGNPNANVIGASGVVYALASFVLISGFIKKQPRLSILSFFVIFMYGSFFWGMLPMPNQVSWEGHLAGFIAGIIIAFLFKEKGPQPKKYLYEIEEELEKNININYIYKEENTSEQRAKSLPPIGASLFNMDNDYLANVQPGLDFINAKAKKFQDMFEKNGITVNVIVDNTIPGLGQVDPTAPGENPTIRISPNGTEDTIPHEFAHIYLDLLGLDNPLVKKAIEELSDINGKYGSLQDHMREHYRDYSGDMYDKEILATAIGLEYIRIEKTADAALSAVAEKLINPTKDSESPGWFKNVVNAIKKFLIDLLDVHVKGTAVSLHVEALTREMLTGNLQSENFIGEFNPVLQESRD
jgi:membrane associated rhomboid family serine protease